MWDYINIDKLSLPIFIELTREHKDLKWENCFYMILRLFVHEVLNLIKGDKDFHMLFNDHQGVNEINSYFIYPTEVGQH